MKYQQFIAVRAFIVNNKKEVLIIREADSYLGGSNKGKYDFPGGKVKNGENFLEALQREVMEESGLSIEIKKPFHADEWRPEVRGKKLQIIGIFFECKIKNNSKIKLGHDHDEFKWIKLSDYSKYNLIQSTKNAFETYIKLKTA